MGKVKWYALHSGVALGFLFFWGLLLHRWDIGRGVGASWFLSREIVETQERYRLTHNLQFRSQVPFKAIFQPGNWTLQDFLEWSIPLVVVVVVGFFLP